MSSKLQPSTEFMNPMRHGRKDASAQETSVQEVRLLPKSSLCLCANADTQCFHYTVSGVLRLPFQTSIFMTLQTYTAL